MFLRLFIYICYSICFNSKKNTKHKKKKKFFIFLFLSLKKKKKMNYFGILPKKQGDSLTLALKNEDKFSSQEFVQLNKEDTDFLMIPENIPAKSKIYEFRCLLASRSSGKMRTQISICP